MTEQLLMLAGLLIFAMGLTIYELKHRNGVLERHNKQQEERIERLAFDLTFECQQSESLRNSGKELLANFIHQNRVIMQMRKEKADGK